LFPMKTQAPTQSDSSTTPRPSLWTTLKAFPRPVWIVFLGVFINRFGTFVIPFLALHMTKLGFSVKQTGMALAAYGGGHLAASMIGGHLADTIGRRNTIVLSMFSAGTTMLCLSQAESLTAIIALACLAGVTAEFYKPASSALLADLTSPANRVTAYAAMRFAINAGWAIGPATAGLMSQYSYTWLFVGDAITSFAFGAIAWRWLPVLRNRNSEDWKNVGKAFSSIATACRCALRDRRYRRFLVAAFGPAVVFMQMSSTLGMEIQAAGFKETVYGCILAMNGVLIICIELPLITFTQRFKATHAIAFGYALVGGGFFIFAFGNSIVVYVAGMVVFTLGEMIAMPIAMAYAASLAPEHMRGRYMGVYGLVWGCALTVGPATGLALFEVSPALLWFGCGALGLTSALLSLDLFRVDEQQGQPSSVAKRPEVAAPT